MVISSLYDNAEMLNCRLPDQSSLYALNKKGIRKYLKYEVHIPVQDAYLLKDEVYIENAGMILFLQMITYNKTLTKQ